jgi:hypothetical protein
VLFTVSGPPHDRDRTKPREFKDASGHPLFVLRRKWFTFENAWFLELPGGGGGEDMTGTRLRWSWTRGKIDLMLKNAAERSRGDVKGEDGEEGGAEVKLEIKGQDAS